MTSTRSDTGTAGGDPLPPSGATTTPRPGPARRRRWPRVLAFVLAALLLLAAGLVAGVAWYFSGIALAVDRSGAPAVGLSAGTTVAGAPDGTIVLPDTPGMAVEGLHGIRWQDAEVSGWGITGDVLEQVDGRVVREWEDREGTLPEAGANGQIDQDVFLGDPGVVGMEFVEVALAGELGELAAYRVPAPLRPDAQQQGAEGTWIVFAHGRGGQREEANRYLPLWHDLGYEVLVPQYRNDAGAPQDPSGRYGLGGTEWRDLDTAVTYALDNGAERVVLAGWSMGGAVNLQLMDRSENADAVVAMVLDAPVVDWRNTFEHQGDLAGLPSWITGLAMQFIELRGGLDLEDFDWAAREDAAVVIDVPVYLVHSDDDAFVPNGPSRALADYLGPDRVTTRFEGPGDHTREWNVDPDSYDSDMRDWFEQVLLDAG